jgi:hypothetical protein
MGMAWAVGVTAARISAASAAATTVLGMAGSSLRDEVLVGRGLALAFLAAFSAGGGAGLEGCGKLRLSSVTACPVLGKGRRRLGRRWRSTTLALPRLSRQAARRFSDAFRRQPQNHVAVALAGPAQGAQLVDDEGSSGLP